MPMSVSTVMVRGLSAIALAVVITTQAITAQEYDRSSLPIPTPQTPPVREMDARKATKPAPFEVTAPEGAPNVVVVLIDDIGFGATAPFGGAIETPTFDRLAQNGLRFNRFHTTRPTCSFVESSSVVGICSRSKLASPTWSRIDDRRKNGLSSRSNSFRRCCRLR